MSEATPNRSAQSWQARIGDERVELDDMSGLRELVIAGRLRPEHYVYHPPTQRWIYAREVPELRDSFAANEIAANPSGWIVQLEGHNYPLRDVETVRNWIREGRVRRGTLLRHPVLERWMRASEALELSEELSHMPDMPLQSAPKRSSLTPQTLAVIALVFFVLLLAGIGIYRGTRPSPESGPVAPVASTSTDDAAPPAPAAKPKTITWLFGDEKKEEAAATTSTDTTATTETATESSTESAPPEEVAAPAVEAPPPPQPRRDDAEGLYDDAGGEFQGTAVISGDTPMLVDRSHEDTHYHLRTCPNVTTRMTSVSLDLARQGYTPCPVCKPPR